MRIVIVGAGEIGTHLAFKLVESDHSIVIIESDKKVAEELEARLDARVIVGDGTSPEMLLEADVPDCDVFFALTSENNVNLVATTLAKNIRAKRTVCRVHPALESQDYAFDFKKNFGVDELFSSERLAAVELSKYIRNPDSSKQRLVEEIAGGYIELMELEVPPGSPAEDKTLIELAFPPRVRVCVVRRNNRNSIPTAQERLQVGDVLTLAGPQLRITEVVDRVRTRKQAKEEKNTVIFGGGDYGTALAETLSSSGGNYRIRIFETDAEKCRRLADRFENVTVLKADATSLAELKEENVGDADFFVAATTRDEDNVMTCLQANHLGAKHCLTLFHRADYADAITRFQNQMGIFAAVSPREATRSVLMRFVSDKFHLLRRLEGAELIEVSVSADSSAAGKKVKEIDWPEGSVLVGHWHGSEAQVPSAEDDIEKGDNIYAMVTPQSRREFLRLFS